MGNFFTAMNPILRNSKIVNNSISGFAAKIEDEGTASKVRANTKPFE